MVKFANWIFILGILFSLFIAIQTEVFGIHPDPLSLFPYRSEGHYNPEGYRLVADEIAKKINNLL